LHCVDDTLAERKPCQLRDCKRPDHLIAQEDTPSDFRRKGGGKTLWVLVVAPGVPVGSVAKLIAYAKANPGKLNFGYTLGTASQLIGELFKRSTGTASIPYKGGTGVVPDMPGGRVQIYFGTPATILPLIREGKLKPLAVTARSSPMCPTMIETGLPDLSLTL
jgi:tripartite-type tricarboxylate transporter receptor subunit TctC